MGVPENVASLGRLKRLFMVYQAVVDLLEYRDSGADGVVYNGGGGGGGDDDGRRAPDNCEALCVACGAHLHWYLSQVRGRQSIRRMDSEERLTTLPLMA